MLQEEFQNSCLHFSKDVALINKLWSRISDSYGERGRYYHTMEHLEHMLKQLNVVRGYIENFDEIIFALAYHDIVYKPFSSHNEEDSARSAAHDLTVLNVPAEKIERIIRLILQTKKHCPSDNADINLFTDADLSVLGSAAELYEVYASSVRKEYGLVPDFLYKPGRKKVLHHFLTMDTIFKTQPFRQRFEAAARANIQSELAKLGQS